MKKMILITLVAVFAFTSCKMFGTVTDSGTIGSLRWTLTNTGVLTISGNGPIVGNIRSLPTMQAPTSAVIKDGVTSIGNKAFKDCSFLKSISIPKSVTSIGKEAFEYCYRLKKITIPNGVTSIEDFAFGSCYELKNITIPNGVTSIGNHAFSSCSSLTSVSIPNSVTSIEIGAFSDCSSLKKVTILAYKPPTLGLYDNFATAGDVLHVPKGCVNAYKITEWGEAFEKIVEL